MEKPTTAAAAVFSMLALIHSACDAQGPVESEPALTCADLLYAPPSESIASGWAHAVDFVETNATIVFDAATEVASVEARVLFVTGLETGLAVFDLRQEVHEAELDGERIDAGTFFTREDFAVEPSGGVLILMQELAPCTRHELVLRYELQPPTPRRMTAFEWRDGAVRWGTAFSDLEPGAYLETWLPANLPFDHHSLAIELSVVGTETQHAVVANAPLTATATNSWRVEWPDGVDSMAPLLELMPALDLSETNSPTGRILLFTEHGKAGDEDASYAALLDTIVEEFEVRFGPMPHGIPFVLLEVDGHSSGMEYDGAATTGGRSRPTATHEVLHAWFGRGLRPPRHQDGWIDEGWVSYIVGPEPRPDSQPLMSSDPWTRVTAAGAYGHGRALFMELSSILGEEELEAAMASLLSRRFLSTETLECELYLWSGLSEIRELFELEVYPPNYERQYPSDCPAFVRTSAELRRHND